MRAKRATWWRSAFGKWRRYRSLHSFRIAATTDRRARSFVGVLHDVAANTSYRVRVERARHAELLKIVNGVLTHGAPFSAAPTRA